MIESSPADNPLAEPDALRTARRWERFAMGAAATLLGTSAAFRLLWLDRFPGINGDEAWYAVQVQQMLAGDAWSTRTPTGMPINPLLFGSHTLLLVLCDPSFWMLRLPVAVWSCVALGLTYWLHRRVFQDNVEALLVTTLTACLPTHLAYSRLCWDASFSIVSVPVLLYGLLAVTGAGRFARWQCIGLIVAGGVLTVWNHATHAVFALACLIVFIGAARRTWLLATRRPITFCVVAGIATYVAIRALKSFYSGRVLWRSITGSVERLEVHLVALGDILFGSRVYEYLAGVPRCDWLRWAYATILLAFAGSVIILVWRGMVADRWLAALGVVTFVLVLLVGRRVEYNELSYERYVLYVVPLCGVLFLRGLRAFVHVGPNPRPNLVAVPTLVMAAAFLIQFWLGYFEPLRRETNADRLHRTFWTNKFAEPKSALAEAIRARADLATTLYIKDWWLRWPTRYLLGPRFRVVDRFNVEEIEGPSFVAGFDRSNVIWRVRTDERLQPMVREEIRIGPSSAGRSIVLIVLGTAEAAYEP